MTTISSLPSHYLTRSLEHPGKLGIRLARRVLVPRATGCRAQPLVVRDFASKDEVGVIAQCEVSLHAVIDGEDVGAADRLRLIQDEVLVLAVLA